MCDPWDSQGDEKNAVFISIAFSFDFLSEMKISKLGGQIMSWSNSYK